MVYFGFLMVCYGYLIDFWFQSMFIFFSFGDTDSRFIHSIFLFLSLFCLVVSIAVVVAVLFVIYAIFVCLLCCADCMQQAGSSFSRGLDAQFNRMNRWFMAFPARIGTRR